jgi:hypothetical protein
MNFSICLDQTTTPNFNVANLSTTGFSIYSNLDLNSPLVQNIPYTSLFESPLGTCPFNLTNIPEGTDYLIVVDQCNTSINVSSIFAPENINAGSITINCCYAIINLNPTPLSICDECNLSFDTFSTSTVGRIIAGNLSSTCGVITDYTIGWYRNGSTTPTFISGIGTTLSYNFSHPLVGDSSPMVLDGSWIGIIHDIIINGITYSSVAGVLGGNPLPFTSCFDTMVVAPFTCANGQNPPPYSHQISFTAQGNNATPPPISATYALSSSTNYFAYRFDGFDIFDELEIKFISGNPNGTNNPSLYSQPIWLEKAQIGSSVLSSNIGTLSNISNNTYPKKIKNSFFKRIFTLTNISRSLNDSLEINILPNPTNPQTSWRLQMQCLDTFNCNDCRNDPFTKVKIKSFNINKECCKKQELITTISCSCNIINNDIWSNSPNYNGYTLGTSDLPRIFTNNSTFNDSSGFFNTTSSNGCYGPQSQYYSSLCSIPTPNSTISYHKSIGMVSMSFNNEIDYLHYKNALETALFLLNITQGVTNFNFNPTDPQYYSGIGINLPTSNIPCGDGSYFQHFQIHPLSNISYIETPINNYWAIKISLLNITNQITPNTCNNCFNAAASQVSSFNLSYFNFNFDSINTYGNKRQSPFSVNYIGDISFPPISPGAYWGSGVFRRDMPYYSWNTLPFISSSNGWANLTALNSNPCPSLVSSSMPSSLNSPASSTGNGYTNYGYESYYLTRYPNITQDPNWFQVYTKLTSSNSVLLPDLLPNLMIYEYSASIGTVYSSSYFVDGSPILIIDPSFPNC